MTEGPILLDPAPCQSTIEHLLCRYPLPENDYPFKDLCIEAIDGEQSSSLCLPIAVRIGIFMAQQHESSNPQNEALGIMISGASRKPSGWNSFRLVAPDGTTLSDFDMGELLVLNSASTALISSAPCALHIGWDTREESQELAKLVIRSARAGGARIVQHGEVTTSCLHFCVLHSNPVHLPPYPSIMTRTRAATEHGYYQQLAKAYSRLLQTSTTYPRYDNSLLVDCACGIGYLALRQLVMALQEQGFMRRMVATNRPFSGPINENCGIDYIQEKGQPPLWYNRPPIHHGHCAAMDANAERVCFFSETNTAGLIVLNACQIHTLIRNFILVQVQELTSTLDDLEAKSRVDSLFSAAVGNHFRFSVEYFAFLNKAQDRINPSEPIPVSYERLSLLPWLMNQSTGDALSTLLLVDAILHINGHTIAAAVEILERKE